MDMCFYEEDIDWDGDKELLVSFTHSTGIGARMDSLGMTEALLKKQGLFLRKTLKQSYLCLQLLKAIIML